MEESEGCCDALHLLKNLVAKVFEEGQRVQLHKLLVGGESVTGDNPEKV